MTDSSEPPPDGPPTRRTLLRLAGLAALLGGPGTAGATGAASDEVWSAGPAGAAPTATLDDGVGEHATAVALDGTTAVVGVAPSAGGDGPTVGRAVVFTHDGGTWSREAVLPADGVGQFGRAVALEGDTAVVGSELGGPAAHAGSAAVFVRDDGTWSRKTTLEGGAADDVDLFGTAVDVAGDTVLVGASSAAHGDRRSGAASLFTRRGDGWHRTATLAPGEGIERFGRAVALEGDTAVVGGRGTSLGDSGVAVAFERYGGGWRRQAELVAPGGRADDGFGSALALAGGTVLAGAPTATNDSGLDAGAVHVFARERGGWRHRAVLRDRDGGFGSRFGRAVTLDGDRALVGDESPGGPHVFARSGSAWLRQRSLGDGSSGRGAGTLVSLDGEHALVGSGGPDDRDWARLPVEVFGP